MKNLSLTFSTLLFLCLLVSRGYSQSQDINVRGGSPLMDIQRGDTSPSVGEGTEFGSTAIGTPVVKTFEIQNTHSGGSPSNNVLNITSITKSGTNASDFTITSSISTIARSNSATFTISFNPSAVGLRTATITINSNDPDENPWTFSIQGTGTLPPPEIDVTGLGVSIVTGDATPTTTDNTGWGTVGTGSNTPHTFTIKNTAAAASTLIISQGVNITFTSNPSGYFSITSQPAQNTNIAGGSNVTFTVNYNPLANGTHTAVININNNDSNENPYTFTLSGTSFTPAPEIKIMGGTVLTEIVDGDTVPDNVDGTNYGSINVGNTLERMFTIDNTAGTANLTVSSITLSNTTDFSITTAYSSPVTSGGTTTFGVTFTGVSVGTKTCTVTVNNNDSNEAVYDFVIQGTAVQLFYDSDNDGIFDNIDIDDDNDGIIDSEEEADCRNSPISYSVNYKFLEETFGTGNRTTINTTYDALTTYCYEDGTVGTNTGSCTSLNSIDLNDGEYTLYYKAADGDGVNDTPNGEVSSWADAYWYTGEDHTSGDVNGRMAMFNASYDPGIFYTAHIRGSLANVPITYSFWVLNLDTTLAPGIATRLRPNIKVEFQDMAGNVLTNIATGLPAVVTTGNIPPSINGDPTNSWHQFTANLTFSVTEFQVIFTNNETGGTGNDLALDDIEIRQTLCDFDNDGIADIFDLDDDNDGIPDIVEIGLGHLSNGTGKIDVAWVDANGNGMHDAAEGNVVLDSDGDGVPNYHDLDSDNDSIFDVDESGTGNTGNAYFQNGDGDINGDGVGDGPESEAFREKDVYGDGTPEYFGDGILDIYDFHSSANNYTNAYGNDSQGTVTGTVYYVKDTDGDGIPDYIDTMSNGSTWDIAGTLYASLDANNDGVIDDTNDADGDGIVDLFDTDDNRFGSPRDLDRKLHLFFDGRNDYGEDTNVIPSGDASIMVFIRSNGANTLNQDRIVAGQNDFYLRVNHADNTVSVVVEGTTLTSTTAIVDGRWTHIAATTKSGSTKLYINGVEEASNASGGITDASNLMIGRSSAGDKHYHGYMDELRVFDKALTANEIHKMIYQELSNNSGTTRGAIIPLDVTDYDPITDVASALPWANVKRYFRMDAYKDDILDDFTTASIDTGSGAKIYNTKIIDVQSAPLPFVTQQSGTSLLTALNIPGEGVNGNDAVTYDWSIVKISHDAITYNANQKHVGLIVDALDKISSNPIEFSIQDDSELSVSWYLKLDGFVDLDGESQLVQGPDSKLDVTSSGYIERDQQGTKDLFTYNYWSSPVGIRNSTSNNNSYRMIDNVLKNGTVSATPNNITFLTSGYNGNTSGTNISIADYWIWKFANKTYDSYSSWQHMRRNGTILPAEGFTMKGVANTSGNITQTQNYVFNGKPNNGDITLSISAGNEYLVGNPYPSALDADEFIRDNIKDGGNNTNNVISGALYFWDHFASNTHALAEYQGGYATYTLMGGTPAVSNDARIKATGVVGTKVPGRYIPVAQGFFVNAILDPALVGTSNDPNLASSIDGGNIIFKNSQRAFVTETSGTSLFVKNSNTKSKQTASTTANVDSRQKIRLKFDSPKGYHRQLLVGADENASNNFDLGYDAPLVENNNEDLFWVFNNNNFIIQAVNKLDVEQILPLGIKISKQGLASIKIEALENIDTDLNIYLHDKQLNTYHNLKESKYDVYLSPGKYLNRFEVTFANEDQASLNTNNIENSSLQVYFSNENRSVIIHNPHLKNIISIEIFNVLGQSVFQSNDNTNKNYLEYKPKHISSGTYIIKLKTDAGIVSKKVLIN
ncbi:choice-of-anchor D domain-containing protein [Mariniflexile sp. HNIBRBA6329]|uniref:choice-of-anchor D domain-containing protein n=1 Tax=Mariniflexile sp. HNIBRBA6329 TaxID=3373088 RepID=UPI003745CD70